MLFVLMCPKCGSSDLRPSRSRHLGEWLVAVFAAPYRCRLCDHRELVMRFATPGVAESTEQEEPAHENPARNEPDISGQPSVLSKPGRASLVQDATPAYPAKPQTTEAGNMGPHSPVA